MLDRLSQRVHKVGLGKIDHRGEEPMIDLHATDRRDLEDLLRGGIEAPEPALERIAQAARQGETGLPGRHQLFGEEGVAT